MNRKKSFAKRMIAAAVALIVTGCSSSGGDTADTAEVQTANETTTTQATSATEETTMEAETNTADFSLSAMDFVKNIKIGWNLGNTLDAEGDASPDDNTSTEMSWGNPRTSPEILQMVKDAGFNTIRIPTTWYKHFTGETDYTILPEWMDRVQEIVDMALEGGCYVILNMHHEERNWLNPTYANQERATEIVTAIWQQAGERFKDYDEHLIFETMNEPRSVNTSNEWNGGSAEGQDVVNQLNQVALDTIRASGGYNDQRYVMVPTYAASIEPSALNAFVLPDDPHVIVSLHAYQPYDFALNEGGTSKWYPTENAQAQLNGMFDRIMERFVNQGIPVIIGETGSLNKNNVGYRVAWSDFYIGRCAELGIPVVLWDDGGNFGLMDRYNVKHRFPDVIEASVNAALAGKPLFPLTAEEVADFVPQS
jgi:endoglucanase